MLIEKRSEANGEVTLQAKLLDDNNVQCLDAANWIRFGLTGDGKTNRFYAEGWKSAGQSLSWTMRLAKEKKYNVVIKYLAGENSGGSFKLVVDDTEVFDYAVETNKANTLVSSKK